MKVIIIIKNNQWFELHFETRNIKSKIPTRIQMHDSMPK